MKNKFILLTLLALFLAFPATARTLNVCNFGAKPDGKICTNAINKTISKATAGDTILIPAGNYLTGTIFLKSHTMLKIGKDATLTAINDLAAYNHYSPSKPMTKYDTGAGTVNANLAGDSEWTKALIIGQQVEDVTICGEGTINGQHVENQNGEESMRGPHTIILAESRNVRIEGINITCAGNYAILGYELTNATFKDLSITQGWDGIHIRGGIDINITDCDIKTGDDAIAGGYWTNMHITGCRLNSACNGIRMIEPSSNLYIANCTIYGPGTYPHRTSREKHRTASIYGIVLEPGAWGYAPGHTEGVYINNVSIDNVLSPLVYGMGEDNTCSGLYIDGLNATHITYNSIPLNPQSCVKMWNNISIKNLNIKKGDSEIHWVEASSWYAGSANQADERFADVFYLPSTNVISSHTPDGKEIFNAIMDSAAVEAYTREMAFVHKNYFPDSLNFYSPYYRQATMNGLMSTDAQTCYNKACQDAIDAFDYYMKHRNKGRRFIIAGFSQGAEIAIDLLKHLTDEQYSRLIAAYAIGYGVDSVSTTHPHIVPATGAKENGVCISYNSVRDTSAIWSLVYNNGRTCINPVNWRTDSTPATFVYEGKTLTVTLDTAKHVLLVPDFKPSSQATFCPAGALHVQDLLFYAPYIKRNALLRAY